MDSALLDVRRLQTPRRPRRVCGFDVVHHEVERRAAGTRRAGHEYEVRAAPELQHGDMVVLLDLPHPDLAPELDGTAEVADVQHHVTDPDWRPFVHAAILALRTVLSTTNMGDRPKT